MNISFTAIAIAQTVNIRQLKEKANQGDADAQKKLGDCYYLGKGVTKDYEQAEYWYWKAADQGNEDAELNLMALWEKIDAELGLKDKRKKKIEEALAISKDSAPKFSLAGMDDSPNDNSSNNYNDSIIYRRIEASMVLSYAGSFHEGLAAIGVGEKRGYINKNGKIVIPLNYSSASDFHDGVAEVSKDNKRFFINKQGQTIFTCPDDYWVEDFSEGLAIVKKRGVYKENSIVEAECGFINKQGVMVVPAKYARDEISKFHNGLARLKKNNFWGFIGKNGSFVIPNVYEDAKDFSEGLAFVKKNSLWGAIDNRGNVIIPFQYKDAGFFYDGLAQVTVVDGGEFLIDKKNNKMLKLPMGALICYYIGEGLLFSFNLGQDTHIIDRATGKDAFKFDYDFCYDFHDGLARVQYEKEEKYGSGHYEGFIDKKGKVVIPILFSGTYRLSDFSEGYAVIKENLFEKEYTWIDTKGNPLIIEDLDAENFAKLGRRMFDISNDAKDEKIKKEILDYSYRYYEKAALKGDIESCFRTGLNYYFGTTVNKNYATAVKWLEKVITLTKDTKTTGNEYLYLGYCYAQGGYGIIKDENKAFQYYSEGAKLENEDCMYYLAICYAKGIGCSAECSKAINLAEKIYQKDQKYRYFYADCYNLLAYNYASKKDYTNAITAIDKAISIVSDANKKANFYDSKGEIYLMMGKEDEALQMWKKVLELNRDFLNDFPEGTELYKQLKSKGKI